MKIVSLFAMLLLAWLSTAVPGRGKQDQGVEPPNTVVPRDGCVTSECHTGTKAHAYVHGPLHMNACDTCHTLVDVEAHRYQMARPDRELCLFCHRPSEHGPAVRHAPIESGDCLPCHDPHGGREPWLPRDSPYAEACESCHHDVTGGLPTVHGPAGAGACGACHEPHASSNPRLLTVTGTELCLRCHVAMEQKIATRPVKHSPALEDCGICHAPHAAESRAMLIDEPVKLCTSCHPEIRRTIEESSSAHDAVTSGQACLNCHDPHASDRPGLLRGNTISLCFKCHDQELEQPDGRMVTNIRALLERSLTLHEPTARRDCGTCHAVHGGDHEGLLRRTYTTDMYRSFDEEAYSLCFDCHDRQAVLLEETTEVTGFRNGTLNLHRVHVNRTGKGRSCHVCHDPHAADTGHLLRDSVPFGPARWPLPIAWERRENGGACNAGCHRPYEYDRVDPVAYPVPLVGEQDWSDGKYVPPGETESTGEGSGPPPGPPRTGDESRRPEREVNQR